MSTPSDPPTASQHEGIDVVVDEGECEPVGKVLDDQDSNGAMLLRPNSMCLNRKDTGITIPSPSASPRNSRKSDGQMSYDISFTAPDSEVETAVEPKKEPKNDNNDEAEFGVFSTDKSWLENNKGLTPHFVPAERKTSLTCNRKELQKLIAHPMLPKEAVEALAGAQRRPTAEVAEITRRIMLKPETPMEISNAICKVVVSNNLAQAAKAMRRDTASTVITQMEEEGVAFEEAVRRHGLQGKSFKIFRPTNIVRVVCATIILHPIVTGCLTALILFNSIAVAFTDTKQLKGTEPKSDLTTTVLLIDRISVYIFFLEYIMKMIALGVYDGSYTLFGRKHGRWFAADFFIVLLSVVLVTSNEGSGISMLRAFRAVRPLRSVRAFSGIRAILDSLMQSVQLLGDSVTLLCFSLLMWGMIGVEFFRGVLHHRCMLEDDVTIDSNFTVSYLPSIPMQYCSDDVPCPGEMECVVADPVYPYKYANFDNMASALLTIFQVITLSSWTDIMTAHINGSTRVVATSYFVTLVLFVSWIVLNLFVAVINTVFSTIRSRQAGSGFGNDADYVDIKTYWEKLSTCLLGMIRKTETVAKTVVWNESQQDDKERKPSKLSEVISSQAVELTINTLILINLIMQASQYRGMGKTHENVLFYSEHVFAGVFLAEMLLRIAACGSLASFLSERWNVFDATLVVISYVTLYFLDTNVAFLRSFRVFRAVRLLRSSQAKGLRQLVENSLKALIPAANVMIFFIFGLFLFAGLGKQLLGGELPENPSFRESFDDMWKSTVSLFVVMTGDNWFASLYKLMDPSEGFGPAIVAFYVAFYIWSVWVMLSLFTAVVLESFAVPEEEKMSRIRENKIKQHATTAPADTETDLFLDKFFDPTTLKIHWEKDPRPPLIEDSNGADYVRLGGAATTLGSTTWRWRAHMSLFLFAPNHVVRRACYALSTHKYFEWAVILIICASCFLLILGSYLQAPEAYHAKEESNTWLEGIDMAVAYFFLCELLVKVIARGFLIGDKTYLSDHWNRFDFVLLVMMFLAPSVKTLRVLRALRPLRMVRRMDRMKNIMSALWKSIPMIVMVSIASLFVIVIFGLVGMGLFMGKLDICNERTMSRPDCIGVFETATGYLVPRVWKRNDLHFDDMGSSVFTLLQVVSLNNWAKLMYATMDSTSEGRPPQQNTAEGYAVYFMCYILLGNFFLINIFIGVIIVSINTEENVELLTDDQRNWRELTRQLAMVRPIMYKKPPTSQVRRTVFHIVESLPFSMFIATVLVLYMFLLMAQHHGEPGWFANLYKFGNIAVTGVFVCEVLMRITAYGPKVYFYCHWNKYDFTLVAGNVVCMLIMAAAGLQTTSFVGYFSKILRVGRLLRLVKRTKGIRFLLETLLRSLQAIANAFLMLGFLLFIWGLSGVAFFGSVRHQRYLNDKTNFRTFFNAIMTLFRMGTLDGWNDIMFDCGVQHPYCTKDDVMDDCGPAPWITRLYFSAFYILGSLVVYNLLIGIIIDEFAICYSTRYFDIKPAHIEDFVRTWQMEDEENEGYLPRWQVIRIVRELLDKGNTLGFKTKSVEYQLLLFHMDVIAKKSKARSDGVPGSPRRRSVLQIETGDVDAPYSFKTILLLLAKLRVPDTALTEPELKMRREIKKRATLLYLRNKAFASMRSFHTICKLEKADVQQANTLASLRCDLRRRQQHVLDNAGSHPSAEAFDSDAIDHQYRKQKGGTIKDVAKRSKLALKIMRSVG